MGLQSSAGAVSASEEMRRYLKRKIARAKKKGQQEVLVTLLQVLAKVEQVIKEAEKGWF